MLDSKQTQKKEAPKPVNPTNFMGKMVLGKENYYLIILGLVVIIIGFILMSGGKWTDPNVFPEAELSRTRRITIAPIVVIVGFAIEIYAVFHRSKK